MVLLPRVLAVPTGPPCAEDRRRSARVVETGPAS